MTSKPEACADAVAAAFTHDSEVGDQRCIRTAGQSARAEGVGERRLLDEAVVILLVEGVVDESTDFQTVDAIGQRGIEQGIALQHRNARLAQARADAAALRDDTREEVE